ncbi:hypothetical protein KIPB_015805, partial [Kipferlia bialata]
ATLSHARPRHCVREHMGTYGFIPAEKAMAWSCCLNPSREAPGCEVKRL